VILQILFLAKDSICMLLNLITRSWKVLVYWRWTLGLKPWRW
jgi:hypothetical protein